VNIDIINNSVGAETPPIPDSQNQKTPEELLQQYSFHNSQEKVLVEFYTPWCGACKTFSPTWEQVVTQLQNVIETKQFNCAEDHEACLYAYNINSYPTIKLFQNGKEALFVQPRNVENLLSWAKTTTPTEILVPRKDAELIKKNLLNPEESKLGFDAYKGAGSKVIVIDNIHQLLKTVQRGGTWLVKLHIGSGFDKKIIPTVLNVASNLINIGVLTASVNIFEDIAIVEKVFEVYGFPSFVLMQDGKMIAKYEGEKEPEQIVNFVKAHYSTHTKQPNSEL